MTATRPSWTRWIIPAAVTAILAGGVIPFAPHILRAARDVSLHAPNWGLWDDVSWVIKLHVAAALSALVIGLVILFRRKGTGFHKTLGWSWVIAMGTTAISSLFITGLNGDFWSIIHLLSGWTIVSLPLAIWAIRNKKVQIHQRAMTGMFVGGLIVAGLLSFIPGRIMFETFFG